MSSYQKYSFLSLENLIKLTSFFSDIQNPVGWLQKLSIDLPISEQLHIESQETCPEMTLLNHTEKGVLVGQLCRLECHRNGTQF